MKVKKGFMYGLSLIICLCLTSISFGQSSFLTLTRNAINNYREKIINTPLKVTLKFKKTIFYHDYIILEILPDNKAKVQIPNSKKGVAGEEMKTKIMDYSVEYQLPYIEHEENALIYMFQDRYYYERWDPQDEVGHYIEAYDGKDAMLINTYKIVDTGEVKREGKIYPGTKKSLAIKFSPLMAWGTKDWPTESFSASDTEEGIIKVEYNKDNRKFISLISPRNHMFLSTLTEKPNLKVEMRVNNTIDIKDMSLPSDIEELKYNHERKPEYFFHFKDIKYEILNINEFDAKCRIALPEGTIIREDKGLIGLPE